VYKALQPGQVLDVSAFAFAGMVTVNAFPIVSGREEAAVFRHDTAAFYFSPRLKRAPRRLRA
jgi:hypothetical protein